MAALTRPGAEAGSPGKAAPLGPRARRAAYPAAPPSSWLPSCQTRKAPGEVRQAQIGAPRQFQCPPSSLLRGTCEHMRASVTSSRILRAPRACRSCSPGEPTQHSQPQCTASQGCSWPLPTVSSHPVHGRLGDQHRTGSRDSREGPGVSQHPEHTAPEPRPGSAEREAGCSHAKGPS